MKLSDSGSSSILCRVFLGIVFAVSIALILVNLGQYRRLFSEADGARLPNGKTLGGDFICFYVAARAFRADPALAYDHEKTHAEQRNVLEGKIDPGLLPFVYPPLVAAFFIPFALLAFTKAAYLWMAFCVYLVFVSLYLLQRGTGARGLPLAAASAAAVSYVPLFVYCIGGGQTTCLGLLLLAGMFAARTARRELLAGLILAGSYYKPPLFLGLLLFQLVGRRREALRGFAYGAAILLVTTWITAGNSGIEQFVRVLSSYGHGEEILPGYLHSNEMGSGLFSWLLQVFPESPFAARAVFFVIAATMFIIVTRTPDVNDEIHFSLQIACSLLISIWVMHYDYALLSAPLFLLVVQLSKMPWSRAQVPIIFALTGLYFSYLIPPVQLFGGMFHAEVFFLFLLVLGLIHFERVAARG